MLLALDVTWGFGAWRGQVFSLWCPHLAHSGAPAVALSLAAVTHAPSPRGGVARALESHESVQVALEHMAPPHFQMAGAVHSGACWSYWLPSRACMPLILQRVWVSVFKS